jgi:hypothetical protein
MKHYVCTGGCGGVSDKPGVCQAPGCPKHQHPLIECSCTDNKHAEAFAKMPEKTQPASFFDFLKNLFKK